MAGVAVGTSDVWAVAFWYLRSNPDICGHSLRPFHPHPNPLPQGRGDSLSCALLRSLRVVFSPSLSPCPSRERGLLGLRALAAFACGLITLTLLLEGEGTVGVARFSGVCVWSFHLHFHPLPQGRGDSLSCALLRSLRVVFSPSLPCLRERGMFAVARFSGVCVWPYHPHSPA